MIKIIIIATLLSCGISSAKTEETPSIEKMWELIQQQQATIKQLQAQINNTQKQSLQQQEVVQQTAQAIEVISESIDNSSAQTQSKYKFGGYGELHYGNTDGGNSIDFHRFVMFNSYAFNDKTTFFSELEVEHAFSGDGKPGEVELEQAFIEHKLSDNTKVRVGVSLLPVGILNQTHEPDTFYGVERNNVEKNIIPATWWAAGLGFSQEISNSFGYDIYLGEGLNVPISGSKAFLIRSGRQKSAKALANDASLTARIRFSPMNNLQLNASLQYQQDITQGALGIDATLFEANAQYSNNGFSLRALYARWELDNKVKIIAAGREQQDGYYIEPSYRFGTNNQYGVFTRFSNWDNKAGDDNTRDDIDQLDIGFNYWLTPTVVFKFDYQDQSGAKDEDGIHLGMGYSF
jgi:hypothetical protein